MSFSLEVRDLKLVRAIVERGSVTRAAASLHLSQSALSHQLKNLEARLDRQLFERRGKRLHLTPAGSRLLELSAQVLEPLEAVERELARAEPPIPLRIATQCYTAYHWLPRVLPELERRHPRVELQIMTPADALRATSNGELDLTLCVGEVAASKLVEKRLFDDELVLVLPPHHPLSKQKFVSPAQISDEPMFLYEVSKAARERARRQMFPRRGGFSKVTRIPLTEAILELVASGLGLTIMPSWAVMPSVRRGELSTVRLTKRGIKRHWRAAYSPKTPARDAIETLLSLLKAEGPSPIT